MSVARCTAAVLAAAATTTTVVTPKVPGARPCCGRASLAQITTASPYHLSVPADGNLVHYRTDGVHRLGAVWSTGIRR